MKKTIRKYIKDFILQFLYRHPCRFTEKLRMVGIVIFGNWSMSSNMLLYPFRGKFPLTTQEKVIDTYGNGKIDEQSFQNALQYLSYVQRADDQIIHPDWFIYNEGKRFGSASAFRENRKAHDVALKESIRLNYFADQYVQMEISALEYHHGLKLIPAERLKGLDSGIALDIGSGWGDSAFVLAENYPFKKIYSFDPSPENCSRYSRFAQSKKKMSEKCVLVPLGISDHPGKIYFRDSGNIGVSLLADSNNKPEKSNAEVTTIDLFLEQHPEKLSFIKADVEGMALKVLRGGIHAIRRDLPILSICVYHNEEEFLGVFSYLRSLNLPYHYELKFLCAPHEYQELTLIAYPTEPSSTETAT